MTGMTYTQAGQLAEPCTLLAVLDTLAWSPGGVGRVPVAAGTVLTLRGYPGPLAKGAAQVRVVRGPTGGHQLLCLRPRAGDRRGRLECLWMPLESVEVLR